MLNVSKIIIKFMSDKYFVYTQRRVSQEPDKSQGY